MNKYRINSKDIPFYIITAISCFFINYGGLTYVYFTSNSLRTVLGFIYVVLGFAIIFPHKNRCQRKEFYHIILVTALIAVTLRNNGWPAHRELLFCGTILLVLITEKYGHIHEMTLPLFQIFFIFYAIMTIVLMYVPKYYLSHVVNLFPDTRSQLIAYYSTGRMPGFTHHYSTNAMFLSCGLIIGINKFLTTKQKKQLIYVALLFISLLLTGKRAHIIFSAVSLYVAYSISLRDKDKSKTSRLFQRIGIILVVACLISLLFTLVPSLATVVTRIRDLLSGDDVSGLGRFQLWNLAIESFKEHPLLGIGWKQYVITISVSLGLSRNFDTHNVYLQLLCETGIIGFIIYVYWFIYCIYISIKVHNLFSKTFITLKDKYYLRFSISFQVFFLLYCLTGNPLYDPQMFIPYFVACGISLYYYRKFGYCLKGNK